MLNCFYFFAEVEEPDVTPITPITRYTMATTLAPITREQCIATTLADSRCKNLAKPPVEYCYTHRGQSSTKNAEKSLIVFDWDDTLISSTHLCNVLGYNDYSKIKNLAGGVLLELEALQKAVIAILELSLAVPNSTTIIITNGIIGWVECSCRWFLPRVLPYLEKLTILSARSRYETRYPNNPRKWKRKAFKNRVRNHCGETAHSVISIGDSSIERKAVQTITKQLGDGVLCKSIKFIERPKVFELSQQLYLLVSCFDRLISHHEDLDLMMELPEKDSVQLVDICVDDNCDSDDEDKDR